MTTINYSDGSARESVIAIHGDLLAQLNAFVELANDWFGEDKMPEDWRGRCVCANAVMDKARRG